MSTTNPGSDRNSPQLLTKMVSLRQRTLTFEEDAAIWRQLPADMRQKSVCLLEQMLLQTLRRNTSEGELQ